MQNIGNRVEIKNGRVVALKADLRKREIRITIAVTRTDATLAASDKIESYPEDMIYDVSLQAKQIEMVLPGMTKEPTGTELSAAVAEKLVEVHKARRGDGKE